MYPHFERPVAAPAPENWATTPWVPRSNTLSTLRRSAKRSLLLAATQFLQNLSRIAAPAGLDSPTPDLLNNHSPDRPILLTGHQPVIFHPGLVWKYQLTQTVAAARHCSALALIIDSDEDDPGEFPVPQPDQHGQPEPRQQPECQSPPLPQLRTTTATFSSGSGLYAACKLAAPEILTQTAAAVRKSLLEAGCDAAAESFSWAASAYSRLPADTSMVNANTLVRRAAGIGGRIGELPLTTACGLPEVLRFFAAVLARPADFHSVYNGVLDRWRQQQGIRNDANPFPNLQRTPEALELPFWLVDIQRGCRNVVWLHTTSPSSTSGPMLGIHHQPLTELLPGLETETLLSLRLAGQLLVPRGALITATLRLLFSDLFIHGLGGGRYDPATDELIREWWQESPPPFAVASASMCLFPRERFRLRQLQEFQSHYRDLQFNPGRYLDQTVFSPEQAAEIRRLLDEKQAAVADLQRQRAARTSGQDTGRRIQQLSDAIRSRVITFLQPQLRATENLTPETVRTIESRTWPWFFFSAAWDGAPRTEQDE